MGIRLFQWDISSPSSRPLGSLDNFFRYYNILTFRASPHAYRTPVTATVNRILITHWVTQAFKKVHIEHKEAIIVCFKSVGLSLPVDGSEDHLLKVRDCLYLSYRDWRQALDGIAENLAIINDDIVDTIEVDNNERGVLYTAKEVAEGITIKEKDENDMTTNSGISSDERFNLNKEGESDFDNAINGNEDMADENI